MYVCLFYFFRLPRTGAGRNILSLKVGRGKSVKVDEYAHLRSYNDFQDGLWEVSSCPWNTNLIVAACAGAF